MTHASKLRLVVALLLQISVATAVKTTLADTAIETETAQIGEQGEIGVSQSLEYEKATDGYHMGTLTQFEYGITDRSEILIEPFFPHARRPMHAEANARLASVEA